METRAGTYHFHLSGIQIVQIQSELRDDLAESTISGCNVRIYDLDLPRMALYEQLAEVNSHKKGNILMALNWKW
jgi:hypothetical protein